MTFENILVEKNNAVATITINRPSKLNALKEATIEEPLHALKQCDEESRIRAMIITGSGEKAFVAGAHISEFAMVNTSEVAELARKGQELLFEFVERWGTPGIAAVYDFALRRVWELSMASHIRVASYNAR